MKSYFIVLLFTYSLYAQNFFNVQPKYNPLNLKLLNEWIFQSMEIITYAELEESETIFRDNTNQERIRFNKSSEMEYFSNFDGGKNSGSGRWLIKNDSLSIIISGDTINASYKILDDILLITTVEKETEEFYKSKTIMKYEVKKD